MFNFFDWNSFRVVTFKRKKSVEGLMLDAKG
jgi:hypothetical protein